MRMTFLVVSVVTSAVMLSGCATTSARIDRVAYDAESSQLQVFTDTCNEDVVVTASETAEISLSAEVPRRWPGSDPACQDMVSVLLDEPVGDRAVIDGATGRRLPSAPGG